MTDHVLIYDDPAWLQAKYWDDGLSLSQMAEKADVNKETVRRAMRHYDIERRVCTARGPTSNLAKRLSDADPNEVVSGD